MVKAVKKSSNKKTTKSKKTSKKTDKKTCSVVELPSALDIVHSEELCNSLKELAAEGGDINLDGSKVGKVTTPAVQILLSLASSIAEGKKKFRIQNISDEMEEAFLDLGFGEQLKEWK